MKSDVNPVDWRRRCAAVIPCFNEAASIAAVVRGVRAHLPSVLVVDDGSTDDTARLASEAGAELVRHTDNHGKGAALRAGLHQIRDRGFQWAITLDGDGQHEPEDIPRFFQCAEQTGAALVIGNRLLQPAAMPWLRRGVNHWMTRRLSRLTGVALEDSQCGFRLLRLDALAGVTLKTERFEIESEMLVALARAGARIQFVPVQTIYKTNASKIHPLADTWRWLRWWWRG